MIETLVDQEAMVNLISEYGDRVDKWIKTTIEEYFFHLRNETLDFELLHKAEKLAFLETMLRHSYRFLMPLDEFQHNEDNVVVGI